MPTVADIAPICALLTRLTPGQPLRSGALTCIPLLTSSLHDPDWLTLTDARDAAVVTEVDQDGVVSALSVTNRAGRPLLLLDGDELVGAKQNRVLNTTVLVAARSQLTIPVSCVEQGRWQRRGERFAPGNASLYALLRARKAARVSESLGRGRGHCGDSHELWAALRAKAEARDVTSPTAAMSDVYAHDRQKIEKVREARTASRPGGSPRLRIRALARPRRAGLSHDLHARVATPVRRLCAADAVTGHEAGRLDPRPSEVLDRLLLAAAAKAPGSAWGGVPARRRWPHRSSPGCRGPHRSPHGIRAAPRHREINRRPVPQAIRERGRVDRLLGARHDRCPHAPRQPTFAAVASPTAHRAPSRRHCRRRGDELGCHRRTVWRDLRVLQDAGFPLYDEKAADGYRGLWRLSPGFQANMPLS